MKGYYLDEHIHKAVAIALRKRGYHCVRAIEVGMEGADDDTEHLPYANATRIGDGDI
jgi:hypothetical protein